LSESETLRLPLRATPNKPRKFGVWSKVVVWVWISGLTQNLQKLWVVWCVANYEWCGALRTISGVVRCELQIATMSGVVRCERTLQIATMSGVVRCERTLLW